MTSFLLSYTLQIESQCFIYILVKTSRKKRLFSKSELNHSFGESHKLEEGTFVLYRKFKVNPKSSRKVRPLETGLPKSMRRVTDVKYKLLSHQGNFFIAHRNHLISIYPVVHQLGNYVQEFETVSSNPQTTICSLNPAVEIYSTE